ncbi:hypothetical protein SAMN05216480_1043 [Pustulibacterium marinum]|uniref:Transposase DDE domain-containing protein n=2 Tax=Pustulibacterium marinum TaxID=1224947 RepID=A0A1I7G9I7_9FLAO|nr:hypothetical protein SAMN05216480_1043 [Pustulibacterium marinum]
MKAKRSSTVEPVFGILTQFMGLAKVNTLGIQYSKPTNVCSWQPLPIISKNT